MKTAKKLLALLLALIMATSFASVAFAANEETENNATPASANVIGVGSSINAKLDEPTDVDWFKFVSDACGLATVTLTHNAVSGAESNLSFFDVKIVDEAGVFVESFKSAGNQTSTSVSFSVIPGNYFIKVAMGNQHNDSVTYTVAVALNKSANVEKESNDNIGDATAITTATNKKPDHTYYGTIAKGASVEGDVDYYKFTVSEKTLVYPSLYNTATNTGKYQLSILDTVTGKDGVAEERVLGSITIASSEDQITGEAIGVKSGTYYVKVIGVDGDVGGYQFRIYTQASSNTELEYNNTKKDANEIAIGSKITGCISDEADTDVFAFTTKGNNSGYKLIFKPYSAKPKTPNGQWVVTIRNSSDGQVDKMDVTANAAGELVTDPLPAGEYFIYITKGNIYTGDVYYLEFQALPKSEEAPKEPSDEGTFIDRIVAFFARMGTLPWANFIAPLIEVLQGMEITGMLGMMSDLVSSIGKFIPFLPEIFGSMSGN